jgi:hypothetical protein
MDWAPVYLMSGVGEEWGRKGEWKRREREIIMACKIFWSYSMGA